MRKDLITAAIVFVIIVVAGVGFMYASVQPSKQAATTPTPAEQTNQMKPDSELIKEMKITDEVVGTGKEAKNGNTVSVNYVGTLNNGTEFDSSYKRNQPFSFTLGQGQVIKGWDLGVAGMKVGGKRKLVIPPDLGYGNQAAGSIPPNSTLNFEVELLDVK